MFDKELFLLLLSKRNGINLKTIPRKNPVIKTEKYRYVITNNGIELIYQAPLAQQDNALDF